MSGSAFLLGRLPFSLNRFGAWALIPDCFCSLKSEFEAVCGRDSLGHARAVRRFCRSHNKALDFERNQIAVVMIRLARFGARKQPFYRIVVIEKDRARNGRSIEVVGTYNPRTNPATVELKHERIAYWRSVGAQFTPTVEKLVAKNPAPAVVAA